MAETMLKDNGVMTVSEDVKKVVKGKRGGCHRDLSKFGEEYVQPGDNSRFVRQSLASWNLPPIDISDAKQVEKRILDYFNYCFEEDRKPNMVGMANWLGVNRDTLKTWKNGEYRGTTHTALIKKAVSVMEEQWLDYMQNGKSNPASLIFVAKNIFGYKDNVDVVVTPSNNLSDNMTPEMIEAQLKDIPED